MALHKPFLQALLSACDFMISELTQSRNDYKVARERNSSESVITTTMLYIMTTEITMQREREITERERERLQAAKEAEDLSFVLSLLAQAL